MIPNGLALERFPFATRRPGFNIAVVGGINHKKNPCLWVEILSRVAAMDPRYQIKVAGPLQEIHYKYYFENILPKMGLSSNIRFFGHVQDLPAWYEGEDINYCLSTSPFESFGYAIAEAMAMGYRPITHAFPDAENIWPEECIFTSVHQAIQMITDTAGYDSRRYRDHVESRYSLEAQLREIDALILGMARELSETSSGMEIAFDEVAAAGQRRDCAPSLGKYHKPERNLVIIKGYREAVQAFSQL